jgi:type IV fimbrial biogenesis protein FimT
MYLYQNGYTLIEGLITVTILGIAVAVAAPSLKLFTEGSKLKSVSETFFNDVKFAHSEAIRQHRSMYVSAQTGNNWCYGIDDSKICDCSRRNCTYNGVDTTTTAVNQFNGSLAVTGLLNSGTNYYILFDGTRGTANTNGAVTFTNNQNQRSLRLSINKIGHTELCSPSGQVSGYKDC